MNERVYVVAGNFQQFATWQRFNNPLKGHYISELEQILGIRNGKMVLYGTWYERDANHDIVARARVQNFTIHEVRESEICR